MIGNQKLRKTLDIRAQKLGMQVELSASAMSLELMRRERVGKFNRPADADWDDIGKAFAEQRQAVKDSRPRRIGRFGPLV
jgi:hypothetical protein